MLSLYALAVFSLRVSSPTYLLTLSR